MAKVTFDYKNILPKVAGQNILTLCSNCIAFTPHEDKHLCIRDLEHPTPTVSYNGCESFKQKPYPQDTRMGIIIVFPIHRTRKERI